MPEESQHQDLAKIWVKAAPPAAGEPARVGVWERHPEHPGGEIWVSGDQPCLVAETSLVIQQLQAKALVRVDGPPSAPEIKPERPPEAGRAANR